MTNHPVLEPAFLYGGFPPKDLRHKFLMAQESSAEPLTEDVLPEGLEIIPLPGHFFDMVGFRTQDDVVYLADCLSSAETLDKYQIGFIYDVENYLKTLAQVKEMIGTAFVPAHTKALNTAEELRELAQYNIDKVHQIEERILNICAEPMGTEEILKRLFDDYHLVMNFEQYVLVGSTVKSYLAWLKDSGRLTVSFDDNVLKWNSIK